MTTLLATAEATYEANEADIEALVGEIQAAGLDETSLDELVQEGADKAGAPSKEASSVNNHGLAFQLACLVDMNGKASAFDLVRRELGLSVAPTP